MVKVTPGWAVLFVVILVCSVRADEYRKGRELYDAKCAICHGINGNGKGPGADSFHPPPHDFTRPGIWQKDPRQHITDAVEHGHGQMPAFSLTPEEINAIIDYMLHTFKK